MYLFPNPSCIYSLTPHVSIPGGQEAVAQGLMRDYERLGQPDCYFSALATELEGKRDRMAAILRQAGMSPIVPEGGYFIIVDVTPLSEWPHPQHDPDP